MSRRYLTLTIDLEGDALSSPDTCEEEARRVLDLAADRLGRFISAQTGTWMVPGEAVNLRDINGNTCGLMAVEER